MVEDYTDMARKNGANVSLADVERIVAEDLRIYEAVEREKKVAPPKAAIADEREDTAAIVAGAHGMSLTRTTVNEAADRRDPILDRDPRKVTLKFPAMMARIKRIMEPRGEVRQRTLAKSLEEVAAPSLARRFVNLFICYQSPSMPVKANPFRDVANPRDRARMFLRGVEDICDASTGAMGPWWVK